MSTTNIRLIRQEDNQAIAKIIKDVLTEFNANKPGTAYFDDATNDMYTLFTDELSKYWIFELDGEVVGGSGIYPTEGLPNGCVELVKIYLTPEARGKGYGRQLIEKCIESANEFGFESLYLETMPELHIAVGLYEACGFEYLDGPLGNTGHFACDLWMLKEL